MSNSLLFKVTYNQTFLICLVLLSQDEDIVSYEDDRLLSTTLLNKKLGLHLDQENRSSSVSRKQHALSMIPSK